MIKPEQKKFELFLKDFKTLVSKKGFKNTIQKDYILEILFHSEEHLTAEEITRKVQNSFNLDIGIATVYRSLNFFEEMNIVESLDVGDGTKRYEFKVDHHHDHMICTNCNKIFEFADDLIELNQIKVAERHGFVLNDHTMTIYGICEDCQEK